MLSLFNRGIAGEPALQIDPVDALPLIRALRGSWYYPHSDIGDAFCYFVGRIAPSMPKWPTGLIPVNAFFNARAAYTQPIEVQRRFNARREFGSYSLKGPQITG